MDKEKIFNLIGACRTGKNDHLLPEMQELARELERNPDVRRWLEESQQFDLKIIEAMRDVPIPAGLSDRLLAGLAEENLEPSPSHVITPPEKTPMAAQASAVVFYRRPLILGLALAATAAAVFLAISLSQFGGNQFIENETMVRLSLDWMNTPGKRQNRDTAPLARYPLSQSFPANLYGWKRVETKYDSTAVIYDISPPKAAPANLIVLRTGKQLVASQTPPYQSRGTNGWEIGFWQEKDIVYILAVSGNQKDYRRHLNPIQLAVLGR